MGKKNSLKHEENGVVNSIIEETEGDPKKVDKKSKKILSAKTYQEEIDSGLQTLTLEETEVKPKEIVSEEKEQGKKEKKSKMSSQRDEDGGDSDEGFQPAIGGGFAALMGDDDDDYDDDDEGEEEKVVVEKKNKEGKEKKDQPKDKKVIVNIKDKQPEREKNKKEKGKKSKGKRRGNDEDDDDIDQLLAEIESEYTGVKKEVKLNEDLPKEVQNKDAVKKEPKEIILLKELKLEEKEKAKEDPKNMDNNNKKKDKVEPVTKNGIKKEETKIETKKTDSKKTLKNDKNMEDDKPKEESNELEVSQKEKKESKQKESKKDEKEKTPVEGSKVAEDGGKKKKKSKTKEDKKREEEESKTRKGPNKKMLAAIQEHIAKQKEEAERLQKEEEEREKIEEERIRKLEEEKRLEEERKERQRIKQKERIKRLKEEGKILTPKQKLEQKRAQAMLEYLKMQGVAIPEAGEKLTSQSIKRSKRRKQEEVKEEPKEELHEEKVCEEKLDVEEEKESWEEEEEGVVDTWDQISDESGDEAAENRKMNEHKEETKAKDNDSCEDEESGNEEHQTEADKRREKAKARMEQRRIDNEKNKSEKKLRAPVVCVLGHVDHGKTKILDKLRRTNVQEGEVGGITQQIGATNVPFDAIRSQTRMVKDFEVDITNLPGLLIIDTPGHESFTNLRTRGSSLCDIAILVVDITQGLEPQTIESINLLRSKKTPFVVALNKVDRVFEWESHPSKDVQEIIKLQNDPSKNDFERRTKEIIQALNVQGLNAALFWENPDARSYVSLVPTSAISGDGMGNLMALTCTMCQKRLSHRLMFSEQLQCTVLEVKTIQGHGTTIDVILVNGSLKEGDTIILAGTEGPIVTQIRSLLLPKPMKEIRVKGQYDELKVVEAALGVKIAARDLEKAIAGLNLQVAVHEDEIELLKEEVDREFKAAMRSMKVKDKGVYVQASTLGALEALLEFFKANKVPYAGIRVGPVVKRDVMKAAAMLEHDPMYAVILAFDVKVERDAQELADKEGVKIFSEETIYHLGDRYVDYIKDYKKKKQDEFRHVAVFPSKLKIIPSAIFNKRDPIVLGVSVEAGILRTGTPICVPSKEFVEIGVVTSLEFDHKVVEIAKKGVSVCMKVEPLPGHTPKLFGRHFDVDDILVSKISRESIDACKQYFRDDLGKTEWKLMAELKKQFNIL